MWEITTDQPEERTFMVLKRSNVTKVQRMLILSNNMFENMCQELKLVLGGGPGMARDEPSEAIKFEAKDIPSEDVLWNMGYTRRGGGNGRGGRGREGGNRYDDREDIKRPNIPGEDGKPSRCHHCESIYHFLNKCPDKQVKKEEIYSVVLFIEDEDDLSLFTKEARNCVALDTCCSSTVSGERTHAQ